MAHTYLTYSASVQDAICDCNWKIILPVPVAIGAGCHAAEDVPGCAMQPHCQQQEADLQPHAELSHSVLAFLVFPGTGDAGRPSRQVTHRYPPWGHGAPILSSKPSINIRLFVIPPVGTSAAFCVFHRTVFYFSGMETQAKVNWKLLRFDEKSASC